MSGAQYNDRTTIYQTIAAAGIETNLGRCFTEIRRHYGIVISTLRGVTTTPNSTDLCDSLIKTKNRAIGGLHNAQGACLYYRKYRSRLKRALTKEELKAADNMVAFMEAAFKSILRLEKKHKVDHLKPRRRP